MLGRDDLVLMARSFAGADWHWAVLALVLMLASLALRSLALQVIVNALDAGRARLRDAFSATSIGLLANSLIPIKVGTVLSPYVLFVLLRRRGAQAAFPTILGVTLTERMFAIATFLALSLAFLGTLDVPAWAVNVLLVCAGLITVPFVAGVVFARRRDWVARECARGGARVRRMGRWLPELVESQRIMRRPLAVLGVTGTQVLAWLFQLAAAVAMLWAFHLERGRAARGRPRHRARPTSSASSRRPRATSAPSRWPRSRRSPPTAWPRARRSPTPSACRPCSSWWGSWPGSPPSPPRT